MKCLCDESGAASERQKQVPVTADSAGGGGAWAVMSSAPS